MGCPCKETANNASKLSEDKDCFEELVGWRKILHLIGNFIISVLVYLLIMIIAPLLVLIFVFRGFFGKNNNVDIKKLIKNRHGRK